MAYFPRQSHEGTHVHGTFQLTRVGNANVQESLPGQQARNLRENEKNIRREISRKDL